MGFFLCVKIQKALRLMRIGTQNHCVSFFRQQFKKFLAGIVLVFVDA